GRTAHHRSPVGWCRVTELERLQTAITRLEQLRDDSTPGPWVKRYFLGMDVWPVIISDGIGEVTDSVQGGFPQEADAELVVSLHRTIDAQLGIRRSALARVPPLEPGAIVSFDVSPGSRIGQALALADAILA